MYFDVHDLHVLLLPTGLMLGRLQLRYLSHGYSGTEILTTNTTQSNNISFLSGGFTQVLPSSMSLN